MTCYATSIVLNDVTFLIVNQEISNINLSNSSVKDKIEIKNIAQYLERFRVVMNRKKRKKGMTKKELKRGVRRTVKN